MAQGIPLRRAEQPQLWRALLGCALVLSLVGTRYSVAYAAPVSTVHLARAVLRHSSQKTCFEYDDACAVRPAIVARFEPAPCVAVLSPTETPRVRDLYRGSYYNRPPPNAV